MNDSNVMFSIFLRHHSFLGHLSFFDSFVFQGLVHLGKGTLTLGPYHCDRSLMMPVAVGGLLSVLVSFLDVKNGRSLITFSVSKIGLCRQGMNGINYPYSLLILVMHMTP